MKKITIEKIVAYKLTHPKATTREVASRLGVSFQYVHELWTKSFPGKKFNESWGASVRKICKTCGKVRWVSVKEVERGGGVYCDIRCRHFRKYALDKSLIEGL